jgi:uncharacterized membrane protein
VTIVKNPIRFLRLDGLKNSLTQSLFFVPFMMVALSLVLSQVTVWIDRQIAPGVLPAWFGSTVESSRAILAAVAGGTITAASIVFSLTLVAVQLAASQFSPRVLRGFLGDRFQQVVMGTVVGTFSYSLFVLREIESAGESAQREFLPQVSITVALVLAVVSLIAVLGSIDHTAKGLRVGSVADDILHATLEVVEGLFVERGSESGDGDAERVPVVIDAPGRAPAPRQLDAEEPSSAPPDDARVVLAPRTGWITGIQSQSLATRAPEGSSILVSAAVGSYVIEGTPLLTLWPPTDEGDRLESELEQIVRIGNVRTMQQDVGFGIIQLVDIAVRALSPGINDPNTASEVVVRLGAVLTSLYRRELPPRAATVEGRWVIRPDEPDYAAYVDLAIEPIRRCARKEPRVLEVLIRTIVGVRADARRRFEDPNVGALSHQLDLLRNELHLLQTEEDRRRVSALLDDIDDQ